MNYLASPPLVIAYGIAGTMDFDFESDPLGQDSEGNDVFLRDIWPTQKDRRHHRLVDQPGHVRRQLRRRVQGDERWRNLPTPSGNTFEWDDASTYVRKAPYFDGMPADPEPVTDIKGARVLALLGDSVTTDHISPAGSIKKGTPPRSTWKPTGQARRLQLAGVAARQPRGDDPRHLRQHQAAQPAARRCLRRLHPRLHPAGRTPGVHLRCRAKLCGTEHSAGRARRQGVRLGLVAGLGGQGTGCSACGR